MNTPAETFPLSHPEQRIFLIQQLYPDSPTWNLPCMVKFTDSLQEDALQQALNQVARDYNGLRLRFTNVAGEYRKYVADPGEVPIEIVDVGPVGEAAFNAWLQAAVKTPLWGLDVPLFRFACARFSTQRWGLALIIHHSIADGASEALLISRLIAHYQHLVAHGITAPLAPGASSLEYLRHEKNYLASPECAADRQFWLKEYATLPEAVELFPEHPEPALTAGRQTRTLPAELTARIYAFCHRHQTNPYRAILAAFYVYLARTSRNPDIVLSNAFANRADPGMTQTFAMLVSTIPLRLYTVLTQLDFLGLINLINRKMRDIRQHERYPYDLLAQDLRALHGQTVDLMPFTVAQRLVPPRFPGVTVEFPPRPELPHPLLLYVTHGGRGETDQPIELNLDYQLERFGVSRSEALLNHLVNLLSDGIDHPERPLAQLNLLSAAEKRRLLVEFNNTEADYPLEQTLHELIERQTQRTPDQTALVYRDQALSYAELNARANQLARQLRERGVHPDEFVPLLVDRSPDMIIGALGILKSGAAYVPIDPQYPTERIQYMIADSQSRLVVTQSHYRHQFNFSPDVIHLDDPGARVLETDNLPHVNQPTDLACLIYTSGSTGHPKGIMLEHRSLVNFTFGFIARRELHAADRIAKHASFSFDASILEIYPTLAVGATLYIIHDDIRLNLKLLNEYYEQNGITGAFFTTQLGEQFIDLFDNRSLRFVEIAGEKMRFFKPHHYRIFNGYGPTECSVYTTDFLVDRDYANIPIGRPLPNYRIYLFDPYDNVQPVGAPGELCIAGAALARGYWRQPEKTAAVFVDNPRVPGERIYRTGDLARWLPEGTLEHLGRIDCQLKIRGFRIEPGEVEAVLLQQAGVQQAAVVLHEARPGDRQLVAYLIMDPSGAVDRGRLRQALAARLPDYMIPSAFIILDVLPLTASGKLDRRLLPAPTAADQQVSDMAFTPAQTPLEQQLVRIWQEVLGLAEPPGVQDDFFALGGHSLLAARLIHAIEITLQQRLPLAAFLRFSTIARLAEVLTDSVTPGENHSRTAPAAGLDPEIYHRFLSFQAGRINERLTPDSLLMRFNRQARGTPIYCCGGFGLAQVLTHHPIIGMDPGLGVMADTVPLNEALAEYYSQEMVNCGLPGPFVLLGHSRGARVAMAIAQRLLARGHTVLLLGLIDQPVKQNYMGRVAQFIASRGPFAHHCHSPEWLQAHARCFPAGMSVDLIPGDHISIIDQGVAASILAERLEARLAQAAKPGAPLSAAASRWQWQVPASLEATAGASTEVSVTLTNTSLDSWSAEQALAAGWHWYDEFGDLMHWAADVLPITLPMAPGETQQLICPVALPDIPGRYRLVFDLLDRAETWGTLNGMATATVAVDLFAARLDPSTEVAHVEAAHVEAARCAWESGHTFDTIRCCERVLAANGKTPLPVFHQLTLALQRWGRLAAALDTGYRGLNDYPDAPELHGLCAELALSLDQPDRAAHHARRVMDLGHPQPVHWAMLGQAYAKQGNDADAIIAYQNALAKQSRLDWHQNLAMSLERSDQWAAAVEQWRLAINLQPAWAPYPELIHALRQLGRLSEALRVIESAIANMGLNPRFLSTKAEILLELGQVDEAIAEYQEGIILYPDFIPNYLQVTSVLLQRQDFEAAIGIVDEGLRHHPDHPDFLVRWNELLTHRDQSIAQQQKPVALLTEIESNSVAVERVNDVNSMLEKILSITKLSGHFDVIHGCYAIGWAINKTTPDKPANIQILAEGQVIAEGQTAYPRTDIKSLPVGFRIPLPVRDFQDRDVEIQARIAGSDNNLPGGPHRLKIKSLLNHSVNSSIAEKSMDWLAVSPPNDVLLPYDTLPKKKIAALVTLRNDGISLLEWIAHYRCLKYDTIFVYYNDNTDGSDALLETLAEHNIIRLVKNEISSDVPPQMKAYRHAFFYCPDLWEHDWVSVIDSDEFIIPMIDGNFLGDIKQYIDQIESRFGASAICLNWKWFPGNLSFQRENKICFQQFNNSFTNDHLKITFRLRCAEDIVSAHSIRLKKGAYAIDGGGRSISLPTHRCDPNYRLGQINHYWQKSFEEYVLKVERGSPVSGVGIIDRSLDNFFQWWRKGSLDPLPPVTHIENVLAEIKALREKPGVSDAISIVENEFNQFSKERRDSLHEIYVQVKEKVMGSTNTHQKSSTSNLTLDSEPESCKAQIVQQDTVTPAPETSKAQSWSPRRINQLAEVFQVRSYLEIGVGNGTTFRAVKIKERTGVDPHIPSDILEAINEKTLLYSMTSDQFFARAPADKTFDLIFIDGLHTFEQTYRDFCNSLLHTHSRSVLLIDATLPNDVYSTMTDPNRAFKYRETAGVQGKAWHGDIFKLVFALHDFHPGLNYRTIVGSGNPQTLVWRSNAGWREPRFNSLETISRLTYFDLMDDKAILRESSEEEAIHLCLSEISRMPLTIPAKIDLISSDPALGDSPGDSHAARLARQDDYSMATLAGRRFGRGIRPVIRWIKGDGLDDVVTRTAIAGATRRFGQRVDYCLCTNGINAARVRDILAWAVEPVEWQPVTPADNLTLATRLEAAGCPPEHYGYWWKWFPERVRSQGPEWILDGDMVITGAPTWFDQWRTGQDECRVTQDDRWPKDGLYGHYAAYIDDSSRLYSGLIALPPGLHYMPAVEAILDRQPLNLGHDGRRDMCEQGVIAAAFQTIGATPIPLYEFPFARAFEEQMDYGVLGDQGTAWGYHFGNAFRRRNLHFERLTEQGALFSRTAPLSLLERFAWMKNVGQWGIPGWGMPDDAAALILEYAQAFIGQTILELGTSRGRLSAMLASLGCRVTTVDRHDRGARQNLEGLNVTVVVDDAVHYLATTTQTFPLIVVDFHGNAPTQWQIYAPLLQRCLAQPGLLLIDNAVLWKIPEWAEETGVRWFLERLPDRWTAHLHEEPLPGVAVVRTL